MAKCLVLTGFGINCETETATALKFAGAKSVDIVHISEIILGEKRIKDYQFIIFPGGFLDGDDLGSAKVQVNRFKFLHISKFNEKLSDELKNFVEKGNLVLGICNGFQFMVKLGLLPGFDNKSFFQTATLTFNDSNKFEDRWVYLKVNRKSPCIYTKRLERLYLPVRHGEGKFLTSKDILTKIKKLQLYALQYADENFNPTMDYPENPNGSLFSIAGVTDITGRLFGLMPHPEAFIFKTNHPRWTREKVDELDGLKIFQNAINYLK